MRRICFAKLMQKFDLLKHCTVQRTKSGRGDFIKKSTLSAFWKIFARIICPVWSHLLCKIIHNVRFYYWIIVQARSEVRGQVFASMKFNFLDGLSQKFSLYRNNGLKCFKKSDFRQESWTNTISMKYVNLGCFRNPFST